MANLKKINLSGVEYGLGHTDEEVKSLARAGMQTEITKLEGIAEGAQVNVIEAVKLNGKTLTVTDKSVDIVLDNDVFKVLDELPEAPAAGNENKIHVVPAAEGASTSGNEYSEYLWTGTKWELIGTFKADVDLTDYAKKGYVDAELAKKVDKEGYVAYSQAEKDKLEGISASANNVTFAVNEETETLTITVV